MGFLSSVIEITFVPLPNWSLPHKRPPHGILLLQKGIRLYVTYRINNSIPSVSISALPSTYLMLHKHCRFAPNMLHFFIHSHYWTCLPSQLYMPHHGLIIILYNYLCLSMLSLKSRAMSYSNFHSICPPTISGLGMHSGDSWVNSWESKPSKDGMGCRGRELPITGDVQESVLQKADSEAKEGMWD